MAASVQFRPQNRDLGMVMREVDEDLAIFLGMRNAEKERNDRPALGESDESKGVAPKPDGSLPSNASQEVDPIAADHSFINLESEMSDYNWLVTQPDSSLLPTVEVKVHDFAVSPAKIPNGEAISVKSELENMCEDSASPDSPLHQDSSTSTDSSTAANKRPLSSSSGSRKPTSRASTPTARSIGPAKPKQPRSSTPTSRSTLPSSKPVASQSRSSTPTRVIPRSSTPAKSSLPIVSKPCPRSVTPTRKPDRPSLGRKTDPTTLKSVGAPSRGTSPTVRPRPTKPTDMLSVSHDAIQNPKVSVPKRPVSASRGRVNKPVAAHLSSSNEKPRQKSCSPPKARAPMSKILLRSRGCVNEGDDVNPVLMGTKMVDRVVSMRKLAPPRQDEYVSQDNTRKSSQENSGFGRSLSKKSLDMAIRHMDIRRSISDK